jgi:hypothetical protein
MKTTVPRQRPSGFSLLVLLVGLVLTGSLTWVSASIHDHNETRLLKLELTQAGSVVSAAIPSIQIPLVSAAELAAATNGDPVQFQKYIETYVGVNRSFVSASLWRVEHGVPTLVTSVGTPPVLTTTPTKVKSFLGPAQRSSVLSVLNLLGRPTPAIGYGAAVPTAPWVVYAERVLPRTRRLNVTRSSAFSQLQYEIYLGRAPTPANLLEASTTQFPTGGPRATVTVPFGTSAITLVAAPNGELGGTLLERLPWIVLLAGILLSLVAAVLADYLVRRRRQAEWLATENRRMYREQRSIASVLQQSLLPQELPEIAGVETAMRYVAAGEGADVGGDWYDVIPLDDTHFMFVLGDVSGHGIEAATIMARLHFAIRAYAVQGDGPAEILGKLRRLLSIDRDQSFATILCALVDVTGHSLTLVNAGHPPLLLLNGKSGDFVRTTIFPPIGIEEATEYRSASVVVPERATIVAFTDGLIERRGEPIDAGLERLRALTTEQALSLEDLLTRILNASMAAEYHDDTAILAVRWMS